jgi:hypothetical protein
MKRLAVLTAAAALVVGSASAQAPDGALAITLPYFTEVLFDVPGTDNGFEGFELSGTPGYSLSGYYFLEIEGDGTGAGIVDRVLSFPSAVIGTNGLFVWRDAATALNSGVPAVLLPGYNPATTVHVQDFNPDLENGTSTFIIGVGTPPAATTDLDVDNDGVFDVGTLAGFTVIDAVGMTDGGASDRMYGAALGFSNTPIAAGQVLYRIPSCSGVGGTWAKSVVSGTNPGPYFMSSNQAGFPFSPGVSWTADIGRANHCVSTLQLANSGPGTALTIANVGATANALYLTALTFNAGNATSPYTGPHAGLVIDLVELYDEAFSGIPPFVGVLDGAGGSSFTIDPMPVLGATLYGATLVFDGTVGDFVGRTAVVSVSL